MSDHLRETTFQLVFEEGVDGFRVISAALNGEVLPHGTLRVEQRHRKHVLEFTTIGGRTDA